MHQSANRAWVGERPDSSPDLPDGRDAPLLRLTESAARKITEFMARGGHGDHVVRLRLVPEAALESKYELEFVGERECQPDDVLHQIDDLTFVFDPRSAQLVRGTTMDWVEGMWRSGFRFDAPDRFAMMADPLARAVQGVIDANVTPTVARHGGHVTLQDVRDGRVFLEFGGGCQGCGLAPVTVRSVVERTLREALPGVRGVVDVTDHAAGTNPYQ